MKARTRKRPYVGLKADGTREVVMSAAEPTAETHGGSYAHCTGPFGTKLDAQGYINERAYLSPVPVYAPAFRARGRGKEVTV